MRIFALLSKEVVFFKRTQVESGVSYFPKDAEMFVDCLLNQQIDLEVTKKRRGEPAWKIAGEDGDTECQSSGVTDEERRQCF